MFAGRFIKPHTDEQIVGEVQRAGVLEVVADDTLIGRLDGAEGFLAGRGGTTWLEGHFHRIEFIIRKPATILSSHLAHHHPSPQIC